MAVAWPASLQDIQFLPISVQPIDERIVTQMEGGLVKVRRTSSRFLFRFSFETFLTGAQFTDFRDFYNTQLEGGSLPFDWENPLTDVTPRTMRFQPQQNPPWQMTLEVSHANPSARVYRGVMHMETV